MKVSRLMSKSVVTVNEDTPVKEVARIIFSLGISGVPVLREGKLVGIVTEKDLLSKMYPSLQDLAEDYIHVRDFSQMERNLKDLLQSPVKKIMNIDLTTINEDAEIMEAQSVMILNKFSRVPVVDKRDNLVGIISQGDIFRNLIKDEIPQLEKEKYADFIGRYYDVMVDWKKRFDFELPVILDLFRKEKVNSVIDLGVWTGEYSIGLAKASKLKILGLDHNKSMIDISQDKRHDLKPEVQKRIDFKLSSFANIDEEIKERFDAAICMGGSLPYLPITPKQLFPKLSKVLRDKNGLLVLQILNFNKIVKAKGKLLNFRIQHSDGDPVKEHLFIEFFETLQKNCLYHHVVVFDFDGVNWIYKGLTSIEICESSQAEIEAALRNAGFTDISFSGNRGEYQGEYGKLSFKKQFDPEEDDWLNVVARKK